LYLSKLENQPAVYIIPIFRPRVVTTHVSQLSLTRCACLDYLNCTKKENRKLTTQYSKRHSDGHQCEGIQNIIRRKIYGALCGIS